MSNPLFTYTPEEAKYLQTCREVRQALLSPHAARDADAVCEREEPDDDPARPAFARDVVNVVNYVSAAELAVRQMDTMPLCLRLLRTVHAELLKGVRGSDKHPGEVRISQNWIGPTGCDIQHAAFVPPNLEDMWQALGELEHYLNRQAGLSCLPLQLSVLPVL